MYIKSTLCIIIYFTTLLDVHAHWFIYDFNPPQWDIDRCARWIRVRLELVSLIMMMIIVIIISDLILK
jgi:hypothetical protein